MVKINESKRVQKELNRVPREVLRSYEVWIRLIESHGTDSLRKFFGYNDEALKGEWIGFRSSRLNLKWRVIYQVHQNLDVEIVDIVRVTAHDYRR